MKIKPEHYAHLRNAIASLPREKLLAHKEALAGEPNIKNLDMRFRWDCLWATRQSAWFYDNVYTYAHDDHIDTALRNIVKELAL